MSELAQNTAKPVWPWLLVGFISIGGWIAAGVLLLIVNSHNTSAEEALKWKRQAGKAYTELLVEKSRGLPHDDSDTKPKSVMIPPGTLIECKTKISIEDRELPVECESVFYPPENY